MPNLKTPGRPRLYETASAKVDAFRKRQESSGYLRKEILVTAATWERLAALAVGHGVGVADAASGLLEFGLDAYSLEGGELSSRAMPAISVGVFASTVSGGIRGASTGHSAGQAQPQPQPPNGVVTASQVVTPDNNPISNFFSKRKDSTRA